MRKYNDLTDEEKSKLNYEWFVGRGAVTDLSDSTNLLHLLDIIIHRLFLSGKITEIERDALTVLIIRLVPNYHEELHQRDQVYIPVSMHRFKEQVNVILNAMNDQRYLEDLRVYLAKLEPFILDIDGEKIEF